MNIKGVTYNGSNILKHHLADIISIVMDKKGISSDELSKHAGIGRTTIYMIKNAQQMPKVDTLLKIALFLGISMDTLVGTEIKNKYNKIFTTGLCLFCGLVGFIICLLIKW